MSGKVYFGNADKQTWIVAPKSGLRAASTGSNITTQLLNGRKFVKRSRASSRDFDASWFGSMNDTTMSNSLHTIKDFADGIYGTSNYYWLDPFAMSSNILPPHWAAPMLAETDWPKLDTSLSVAFTAGSYANSYPSKYAAYTTTGAYTSTRKLTIIIPQGYTFHFGWHSTSAGITSGVQITRYNRSTGATSNIAPTSLLAGGTTRTNTTVDGTTYSKVEIMLNTASAATVNIVGMIGQILYNGSTPATGGFITGRGTTALQFSSGVDIEYYTSAIQDGQIGLSVMLTEVD